MPHALREALRRVEPAVDVRVMGEAGGHVPGILMVSEDFSMVELVDDLLLIWSASEADEWRDRLVYLPLVPR